MRYDDTYTTASSNEVEICLLPRDTRALGAAQKGHFRVRHFKPIFNMFPALTRVHTYSMLHPHPRCLHASLYSCRHCASCSGCRTTNHPARAVATFVAMHPLLSLRVCAAMIALPRQLPLRQLPKCPRPMHLRRLHGHCRGRLYHRLGPGCGTDSSRGGKATHTAPMGRTEDS